MSLSIEDQDRLDDLLGTKNRLDRDALRCYRPLPSQIPFHESRASEVILRGGNRCLGGEQEIFDPVEGISRRVDSIDSDFYVWSKDPSTGKLVIGRALKPFIKAVDDLYRVHLSNGQSVIVTKSHHVLSSSGWLSIAQLHRESAACLPLSTEEPFPLELPQGAPCSSQKALGSQFDCRYDRHSCDEQLPQEASIVQGDSPSPTYAHEHIHHCSLAGDLVGAEERTRTYQRFGLPSRRRVEGQERLASSCGSHCASQLYSRSFETCQEDQQFPGKSSRPLHTTCASARPASQLRSKVYAFSSPNNEVDNALEVTITRLEYLRQGEVWDFEVEEFHNYIAGGVCHHNSGKTTSAACQFAAMARGLTIECDDGRHIKPYRNPLRGALPMLMWVIGYDQRHIGQTLHRVLLEPGLFSVIRDKKTGKWRSYRPWDSEDLARFNETKPAEPLIPPKEIEKVNYIAYGQKILESIYMRNGNKICFFASTGEAKQGDAVDYIWIDEDVAQSWHIKEWQARISDRKGRIQWSAFPHSKNAALVDMSDRAAQQIDRPNPDVQEFVLTFRDNPWIDADEKRKRIEGWSYEETRARDLGEFTFDLMLMYDWSAAIQGVPNADDNCPLNKHWEATGALPADWTRYLVLDPGHQTTAVIVAAVPPPKGISDKDWGDIIVIEDEIYLHKASCADTARAVKQKHSDKKFEAFIIDMHAGRQTPMGGVITYRQQYAQAFEKAGLRCRRTGPNFIWGSDNVTARREVLRTWMQRGDDGCSKLRVILDKTPCLQREFKTYRKRITADQFIEDEPAKSPHDAIDCLEYLAAFNPRWVRPEPGAVTNTSHLLMKAIEKLFDRKQPGSGYFNFGAGQ